MQQYTKKQGAVSLYAVLKLPHRSALSLVSWCSVASCGLPLSLHIWKPEDGCIKIWANGPYIIERYRTEFCFILPQICFKRSPFLHDCRVKNVCILKHCSYGTLLLSSCINLLICGVPEIPQITPRENFLNLSQSFAKFFSGSILHRLTRRQFCMWKIWNNSQKYF